MQRRAERPLGIVLLAVFLVHYRWLATKPKIFLMDEPTRGIDVGAKVEIFSLLRKMREEGVSVLFVSSEMQEVISESDRILVMHDGRVAGELSREEATQERIMHLATGGQ